MSQQDEAKHRARYTLEFKLEVLRLVKAGQEASVKGASVGHTQADPEHLGSAGREG